MNASLLRIPYLAACLFLTVFSCEATNGDSPEVGWPAFQNGGQSRVPAGSIATTWSPTENIAWTAEIEGYGQSTPVIAKEQIYVTSVSGDQRQQYHLSAFDLISGQRLWKRDFQNPAPSANTPMVSRAAPTPIADSQGCIAFFEGGLVVAIDRTGTTRWQRDLVADYGKAEARHGVAASLESDDSRVFVWVERSEDPYILALDKRSGRTAWKKSGVGSTSWASPRLLTVEDGEHLVCSASGKIIAVDPKNGQLLWEFAEIANNTSCTPIPISTGKFLIGASDGRGEASAGSGAAFNGVVEVKRKENGFSVAFVWNAEKASCSFGSPVVAGDTVCIVNRAGVLYQLNAKNGDRLSTMRTSAGGIWATPIVSGHLIYLFGSKGTTSVISLVDGTEIAANPSWDAAKDGSSSGGGVLYAAAVASPYLILRRGDSLIAIKDLDP
ncbi:MAG: PQQ-binding-like beta-propeller repeat protein [Rubripirellula sp.]